LGYLTKVLEPQGSDASEWDELVAKTSEPDPHFLSAYSLVFKERMQGEPKLFVLEMSTPLGVDLVVHPFFVREIDNLPFMRSTGAEAKGLRGLRDIVSPWYFGGPACLFHDKSRASGGLSLFLREFHAYCREQGIVSEFCRLHPWSSCPEELKELCPDEIEANRDIVWMDLEKNSVDDIWREYDKKNRNAVRKAQEMGISVHKSASKKELEVFHRLYSESMNRHDASEFYRFPPSFIENLFERLSCNFVLFVASKSDEVLAASIFFHGYSYVHYYLSARDPRYASSGANSLLLHEVALWAKERGFSKFVLGGGTKAEDTLFRFKAAFSRRRTKFFLMRRIHQPLFYAALSELSKALGPADESYFPRYRLPG